jgi:hypothetical protein
MAAASWCERILTLDEYGKPVHTGLNIVPLGCDLRLRIPPCRNIQPVSIAGHEGVVY